MTTNQTRLSLLVIGGVDILIVALGTIGAKTGFPLFGIERTFAFLSFAAAAVGIITFLGSLQLLRVEQDREISETSLRKAITVAVITVYFVIVGETSFFEKQHEFSAISQTMVASFNVIVGVVVAFFFGSSAYLQARTGQRREGESNKP